MKQSQKRAMLAASILLAGPWIGFAAEQGDAPANGFTVKPGSLTFSATVNGPAPASQTLAVTASTRTQFVASASVQNEEPNWLAISPSGTLRTNRNITVSVNPAHLAAGSYSGTITLTASGITQRVPVTFTVGSGSGGGGGGGGGTGYTLIGWNDLGMHCDDGQDYSIFGVLPPYNTIHAQLIDNSGNLVVSPAGYTVTYQAISDPLTKTLNTTSAAKTNFWKYAAALGFGNLAPDVGLAGNAMPGTGNTPQAMSFNIADNTWISVGIPITNYADAAAAPFPVNYYPMMRLVAKNAAGTVIATTDIVLPISDEMSCGMCHASNSDAAAQPAGGWVNNPNPSKDMKLNILRKHDERVGTALEAATTAGPIFCSNCHPDNALSKIGTGIEPLTTAVHRIHASVIDPATSQPLANSTSRTTCYYCHPGPKTQCLRGVMGNLKDSSGNNEVECQSCHGSLTALADPSRQGWLDEPNCQACHTGTATKNSGQIVYTSAFSSGTTLRVAADPTFATNPNTPSTGYSLYRFSSGHGGLQCESCHGSTHAEFPTSNVNDNVQSTNIQGHAGTLAECASCHQSVPTTTNGGPHGLHPIGASWVDRHQDVADGNQASCQPCHGIDYRGTVLSRVQTDRALAGKSFPAGTIIGCYSCHNGPNGGG